MSENLDDVYPPDDDDTRVGDRRYDVKERLIAWSVRQGGRVLRFRVQSFREVTLETGENLDVPEAIECSFSDDDSASAGGDVVEINFSPQEGRKQSGRRPAIVLSPASYNGKVGLAVFCPITNQKKGYIFEVDIPAGERVTGVILSDQVKSLDWRKREAKRKCALPDEIVQDVLAKIAALLNPPE